MQTRFIWLQAITSIHVGAGQTASLIDLPVIREAKTGYPFLPGSGMKGAIRDDVRLTVAKRLLASGNAADFKDAVQKADRDELVEGLFGQQESAGRLLIGDAKLAFIPMRSLEHAFVWVTCPYLLRRLDKDFAFAELNTVVDQDIPLRLKGAPDDEALFAGDVVHVEDYRLKPVPKGNFDAQSFFKPFFPDGYAESNDFANIVIVNDAFFNYLVSRRLPVRTRNRLEPVAKTVVNGALWTEESLPPETILYSVFADRSPDGSALLTFDKEAPARIQIGGNETVGEGWLSLRPFGERRHDKK